MLVTAKYNTYFNSQIAQEGFFAIVYRQKLKEFHVEWPK